MNPTKVTQAIRLTKGRENKNFKYAFWLGYELGIAVTLSNEEKESKLRGILNKEGKMTD